ncbi:SpoIIE family protein phosphatase [Streptomyces sp. 8N706]|uniref:SpoIIE family protein phosphatase n=1 Tax=Streptomyces sp. 8N706 TaxID=3457416 RepID=UPI003FD21058
MSARNAADSIDYRDPLDVTRAATAVLDARDVVIGWSPAAEELLGYPPHEILGRPLGTLLVGRLTPEPGVSEERVGPMCRSEARVARHHDGHVLPLSTTICALADDGAGPAQILVAAELETLALWETHQAMLKGLATQSPIGLAIYDTDLRLQWANAASGRELGVPLSEYVGSYAHELYPGGEVLSKQHPPTLELVIRHVLATGEPVLDLLFKGRPAVDPDHDHIWSCSYYRLQDAHGRPLGVCEDGFDITDRYLAQERLGLMVRASGRIGTTLDMTTTAREITEVAVPQFADTATVDLVEGVLEGEEPSPGREPEHRLVRVAERSAPPDAGEHPDAGEDSAESGRPQPAVAHSVGYPPGSPQARSLSSGRTILEPATGPACDTDRHGGHSCLVVPMRARGATLGLVAFLRGGNKTPYDDGELALADELVARTAVCVDNARRYTREHTAALTLQRNLLPERLPSQSAVEAAYRYLPSDDVMGVGGDWYDVIPLSGTRVGLVVGDVVGQGLHAAATMGSLRTTARALARLDLAPDELLARLDDLFTQSTEEPAGSQPFSPEAGVTCLYAVYDPVSRRCTMARAGHLPPVILAPEGGSFLPDIPPGPPLGLGGLPFESLETELPEGSLIALFTNGLVHTRGRDLDIGLDTLSGVLADHDGSLDVLCDRALEELLPSGPAADDAALLLVRTRALGEDQVAVWELPPDPAAVGQTRAMATAKLGEWDLEELSFTTELVVSELVTNAIRHASPPVHLRLIRDRTLICEVSDGGHTSPNLRRSAGDDEGGRGLFIVAQMVHRWGTRYTPSGKAIWAEQLLPRG